MIYEIKGVCRHCATEVSVLIHNGNIVGECPDCKDDPFSVSQVSGVVYVVSNPNQRGVKIGITTKSVEQRIKQLNSTGVAGRFVPIAIFPSDNLKKHEKKIHEKLARCRIEKEHFDIEPVDAVLKCYRTLNKSIIPIFYDEDIQETFHLKLEQARIEMELRLKGKKLK
ncbi:GIY-YIG nuclease family protein [Pelagicoccus mobilis]|uniref:GIY-YIG nuclease family protein n=1 Tax=Pelagicoccus mobilis TaxID=415221 RepID=A0A934VP99_9BACT|nr:GIY-YIG nuclease family protein [Pelagicoccus mobilis]MBK1875600.1 GIY-YIG nuclease family protein [Pelagicoccus mobilis]